MDTSMSSLPKEVSELLLSNIVIVEILALFSIGAFGAVEVILAVFEQFKKYKGLYFWSMQITAWGILIHAIAAQMRYMNNASKLPLTIPFVIGWICMVTGQALVLYSRLHLVVNDIRHIRWVLWMIITNFIILHIPMTALFFCLNLGQTRCLYPAFIFDRFQVTAFATQDTIICGIYIFEALRALKPIYEMKGREGRRIIHWLLIVNLLGIILNVTMVLAEFKFHNIAIGIKTIAYSIKLKFEFYALNQLRDLTRTSPCTPCEGEGGRVSSDINIFDMLNRPVETVPSFVGTISPPPRSTRSSAYDFHEALRQTVSENSIQLQADQRQIRSDTRSTVEMTLLDSEAPK
jgi:hypothetical protein